LLDNEILLRRNYVIRDELLPNTELPDPEWESAEQHFERGNNFANTGQAEAAMKAFSRTLELDPGFLPARYNRALLLVKQEKWDDAKSELLEVIAMEAGHVEGLNMMGWVLFQLGDLEGAEAHLEKALTVNPSMVLARNNLQAVKEALQKAQGTSLS
jgi:tetratricopeptide (TPR) repeat protein